VSEKEKVKSERENRIFFMMNYIIGNQMYKNIDEEGMKKSCW
jgi:hypothetical protein